ncbi:MAG: hypothetical protein QM498_04025 [Desulfobacterium sp.]
MEAAGHADAVEIDKIETRIEDNEFKPEALYEDAGFVNGESILKAAEKRIELEGPSAGRSQSIAGFAGKDRPLDVADFKVEFEDSTKELIVLSCPNKESPLDQIKSEKNGQWLVHR